MTLNRTTQTLLIILVLFGTSLVGIPLASASKTPTFQGTVYVDGATAPSGTIVKVYKSGSLVGTANPTPVTTQGTYRVTLSTPVNDGDTLTFAFTTPAGGNLPTLVYPADETKTLASSDPDPITMNLDGHAGTYTGVTKLGGTTTGGLIVQAFVAGATTNSSWNISASDGTYLLKVPGAKSSQVIFTVGAMKYDTPYAISGGLPVALDLNVTNHVPTSLSATPNQVYDNVPPLSITIKAVDYDELVDTMTYTVVWGDGTANTVYSTQASNATQAPTHSYASVGQYTIRFYANDTNGGSSSTTTVADYDAAAPTTTLTASASPTGGTDANGQWYTVVPSFTLASTDSGVAGVAGTYYAYNNGTYSKYASSVTLPGGITVVKYNATDNAGNLESPKYYRFAVDNVAPWNNLQSLAPAVLSRNVPLTWNQTDSSSGGNSGWKSIDVWYRYGSSGAYTLWISGMTNTSATFPATQDGLIQFYGRGTDVAGNQRAAPTTGTAADVSTTINTATYQTILTSTSPPDRSDAQGIYWTTKPLLNLTIASSGTPSSGTIYYSWNPNLTSSAYSSYIYTANAAGVILMPPDANCNVLGAYSVVSGYTEPTNYFRVCVYPHTDQAQYEGINTTVANLQSGQQALNLQIQSYLAGLTNSTSAYTNLNVNQTAAAINNYLATQINSTTSYGFNTTLANVQNYVSTLVNTTNVSTQQLIVSVNAYLSGQENSTASYTNGLTNSSMSYLAGLVNLTNQTSTYGFNTTLYAVQGYLSGVENGTSAYTNQNVNQTTSAINTYLANLVNSTSNYGFNTSLLAVQSYLAALNNGSTTSIVTTISNAQAYIDGLVNMTNQTSTYGFNTTLYVVQSYLAGLENSTSASTNTQLGNVNAYLAGLVNMTNQTSTYGFNVTLYAVQSYLAGLQNGTVWGANGNLNASLGGLNNYLATLTNSTSNYGFNVTMLAMQGYLAGVENSTTNYGFNTTDQAIKSYLAGLVNMTNQTSTYGFNTTLYAVQSYLAGLTNSSTSYLAGQINTTYKQTDPAQVSQILNLTQNQTSYLSDRINETYNESSTNLTSFASSVGMTVLRPPLTEDEFHSWVVGEYRPAADRANGTFNGTQYVVAHVAGTAADLTAVLQNLIALNQTETDLQQSSGQGITGTLILQTVTLDMIKWLAIGGLAVLFLGFVVILNRLKPHSAITRFVDRLAQPAAVYFRNKGAQLNSYETDQLNALARRGQPRMGPKRVRRRTG